MNTKEKLDLIYKNPHVWSVGDGLRTTKNEITDKKCTVVGVRKKLPENFISPQFMLPPEVDVFTSGEIKALWPDPDNGKQDVYTDRYRPAPGGVSVGHRNISAGTLGCWVNLDGRKVMLSNNHVLANSNNASLGDAILQPGPHDGGRYPQDHIAHLFDFVPIHFLGEDSNCPFSKAVAFSFNKLSELFGRKTRLSAIVPHADSNLVDAAIADVLREADIKDEILEIGKIHGIVEDPFVSMPIQKCGRTTGKTTGEIIQTQVVVQVSYGGAKIAIFQDQLMAGAMSAGGDSGSLVVSGDKAVGLLFAGSDKTTILNPIKYVLDYFNINF